MHKTLICVEKKDFHRLVDISRQYAGNDLSKCYIFNKKGYTAELYKEKVINGVKCIVFGWSNYSLRDLKNGIIGYDLAGISCELNRVKNGYILMEFEDNMLVNFENKSVFRELELALNVDKILRNDFSLVYNDEVLENEKEEEEEFE